MATMIIKSRIRLSRIVLYALLSICAILFLIPVYVLLATSLKSFKDVSIESMWTLPVNITLLTFLKAFKKLLPNLLNSLILTIPATIVSSLLGSLNGYILSKWKFKGANLIFVVILFGMFIPYQSILIPMVQFLSAVKLYGKMIGLIIIHVIYGIPITTLIFRNYYSELPDELMEASFIDGCGIFRCYYKILLPLSMPCFVVVIIWQFTNIWNEFLFAVTITQNPKSQPITVALQNLAGSQIVEWNVQMAGALLAALPTLLIYILLGKFFIKGLLSGSLK